MSNSNISNIVLGREEVYKASPRIWSFKYADDIVNGIHLSLSNMVGYIKEGKQPVIDDSLLRGAQIHIFGKLLQFN